MIRNSTKTSLYQKTFTLAYSIADFTKERLAKALKTKFYDITVLLIAEYSKNIAGPLVQNPVTHEKRKKYLVYMTIKRKRRIKKDTFEIQGVIPVFKNYSKSRVLDKIKEKDNRPFQKGYDLDEKINSIKYKTNSVFAQNIYLLKAGKITIDEIEEKDPVDFVNNKRKYSDYESHTFTKRKKRRIDQGIIQPSKFKMIDQEYVEKYDDLFKIAKWYNFRLVDQIWNKNVSGLYIWSRPKGMGKNEFVYLLKRIDPNVYEWDKNDNGWQQNWDKKKDYSLIAFNAVSNSKHVPFNIFEDFGDKESTITIKKRFDSEPDYISAQTPWIVTANKPPEEIYPKEDVEVIYERALVVELNEDLFDFINWIAEVNGVRGCKADSSFEDYKPKKPIDDTLSSDETLEGLEEKDTEQ